MRWHWQTVRAAHGGGNAACPSAPPAVGKMENRVEAGRCSNALYTLIPGGAQSRKYIGPR
eukprot:1137111-Pelagomonas_calceolata.AAC.3